VNFVVSISTNGRELRMGSIKKRVSRRNLPAPAVAPTGWAPGLANPACSELFAGLDETSVAGFLSV